jgi:DNA invertase Pin-like site-specific DNA recombinase
MTKAYSYLRFSTPEQMRGDSFRRQTQLALEYADRHGLELDTTLSLNDLGVSAFRGKNARTGALGAFLDAVDADLVPPGSLLLVESLDRVTRQDPWDALPLFQQIINAGITIVTLQDGKPYSRE